MLSDLNLKLRKVCHYKQPSLVQDFVFDKAKKCLIERMLSVGR
jgi:hypothetical protein